MISIEPPVANLDDDALRAGVAVANVPVLLLLLYQITGDERWLEDPYRPGRNDGLDDNSTGGFPPAIQDEIRAAAFAVIRGYRDGAPLAVPEPSPARLADMLSVSMGERVPAEYGPMLAAELAAADDPMRDITPPAGYRVLIIGAGLSGIAMGAGLARAGIDFTVLERAHDVGGTWLRHTYPGAGVDTPSAIYSFSFAPRPWSRYFALRDEVQQYLQESARDAGVYPHIRFGEEVVSARYDQAQSEWVVRTRDDGGGSHRYVANFVISAVGAFTRAKLPDITGLDSFTGERGAHRRLAGAHRPARQAGGGDRQRRQRDAGRAGHRRHGLAADRFPAGATLGRAVPEVWPAGARIAAQADRGGAAVPGSGTASAGGGRSTTASTTRCRRTRSGPTASVRSTRSTIGTGRSSPATWSASSTAAPI